jgi:type I restriction enzyme S subunit
MPKINQGVVLNTLIPLPPLPEQTRIVQKLDELMQTCDELEASIKESQAQNEKLLQQVLREALRK